MVKLPRKVRWSKKCKTVEVLWLDRNVTYCSTDTVSLLEIHRGVQLRGALTLCRDNDPAVLIVFQQKLKEVAKCRSWTHSATFELTLLLIFGVCFLLTSSGSMLQLQTPASTLASHVLTWRSPFVSPWTYASPISPHSCAPWALVAYFQETWSIPLGWCQTAPPWWWNPQSRPFLSNPVPWPWSLQWAGAQ